MASVELEGEGVRRELEQILKSPGFARNDRLSRFLRFVVDRHLEGRHHELKESIIGCEVFGRKPDYDPRTDPIVRTEARRLRARLGEYYSGPGNLDAVVIELPKGGYVPVARRSAHVSQPSTSVPESTTPPLRRPGLAFIGLAALIAVIAVLGWRRVALGGSSEPARTSPAYDLYRNARISEMRPAATGIEVSLDLFEQAIARDPSFAPGYAGVGAMEAARSAFDRFNPSERAQMIAKGWAAAGRAIQLAPRLADASDALGMMQARQAQWVDAERSFRRAIEFAPRDPIWRNHFALFLLLPLGRIHEAIRELRSAEESDASSRDTHYGLYLAFRAIGQFDDAESHCHKAAENDRQSSGCWADTFLRQGKADEAVRVLEAGWDGNLLKMGAQALGQAYASAGRRADAERVAALLPRPASKAQIFAALGDKDLTFEFLDQMIPMGPTRVGRDLISPEFVFLRGDPRLNVLRRRLGLPE